MSTLPLVSIGVPNYNYARYILFTLESIASQSYGVIELIIVDDHSTDNSVSVIENWISNYCGQTKIKFIKNKANCGLTKTCNIILANANGKYIQFLDADDTILPDKIDTQVKLLEKAKEVALVYSDVLIADSKGQITGNGYLQRIGYDKKNMPSGKVYPQLFDFNFIPLPSVLVKTVLIKEAGGFDETLAVQDYYMWLKLTEKYMILYMNEPTAIYRIHENSMSNNLATTGRSLDSILTINYRYYKSASELIRKKIENTIHNSSSNLYKLKYPTAKKWLKMDMLLNPSFKTILYYLGSCLGLPHSFFQKLKIKISLKTI
jgi:glycosyltransferase involved in cell wall biosynthesis